MKVVEIDLGARSYQIKIAKNILSQPEEFLPWIKSNQVFIISNEVVAPIYLDNLLSALKDKQVNQIIMPDGEHTKSLSSLELIFDRMLQIPLDRSATVIALGGGVIGDMAGFAAACYQRGVPFIQVPTTLLSQVDSSVGGKTAVNHPSGKNMIGAFYQPERVLIDIDTLATLQPRQFSSGLAEVIKYGVINQPDFFQWLESNISKVINRQSESLEYIIEQSCLNKARVVEQDEKESGVRALLNLGHTFGHAVETTTGYGKWLHGEAVALGMAMAAHMSCLQGWLKKEDVQRINHLLERAELPVSPSTEFDANQLKQAMKLDKKVQSGKVRLVLLNGIGEAFLTADYDEQALNNTLQTFALG